MLVCLGLARPSCRWARRDVNLATCLASRHPHHPRAGTTAAVPSVGLAADAAVPFAVARRGLAVVTAGQTSARALAVEDSLAVAVGLRAVSVVVAIVALAVSEAPPRVS